MEQDAHWECSADEQQALVRLHATSKRTWRRDIVEMMRLHPGKFSILNVGTTDDGERLYTFDEFAAHFKGHKGSIGNEELLRLMYDDMDHVNATQIKFTAIHRWYCTI